jgi:O-methyltransferase
MMAFRWLMLGSAAQRRRVRQECARIAASFFGDFPISEDCKLWREDKDFLNEFKRLSPRSPYSQDRKFVLREFARFTRNVPGCIAECGCYQGASAFFMAKENPHVPLHLFDSFEGLSEPGQKDVPQSGDHRPWEKMDMSAPEEQARKTLNNFPKTVFHRGWIPDRFTEVSHLNFRLVHIDVDLYQPTRDSLVFFYSRMSHGGVIVLDDYGFTSCPGAFSAVEEFMKDKREHVLHLPTGQGIIIKSGQ